MLIFYFVLGSLAFFLQNFLSLPHQIHLDFVTLFLVFATLRTSFIVAVTLALVLGTMLDCYGMAPLGLHAGVFLLAVVGVEILRRHLNFLYIFPQLVGVAAITLVQGLAMALFLHLLMPVPVIYPALVQQGALQIGVTTLGAPIILALFCRLENLWRRCLLIKT
jgi:rod shape-determining protein MreD